MLALAVFVIRTITSDKRKATIDNLETIVQERSQIIQNYVSETENTLTAYSRAGEILNIMKRPDDEKIVSAAQSYTEKFSSDIDNLEGLYISDNVAELETFVKGIAGDIQSVADITNDNRAAINTIVDKNENTSEIAGDIRRQSEQNKELASRLAEILMRFSK